MLDEAMIALAAAGGTAVVEAAGQDMWLTTRTRLAAWFGRDDAARRQAALRRLDETASELAADGVAEDAQQQQAYAWRTRIRDILAELDPGERARAVDELVAIFPELANRAGSGGATAGAGGVAITGGLHASDHAAAVGQVQGDVNIGRPSRPDPGRG